MTLLSATVKTTGMTIQEFSTAYRVRTKPDSSGQTIIPGKQFAKSLPRRVEYRAHIFQELAHDFVRAARSWSPFRDLSPDCYRISFDAVLRRYVEWDERGLDGDYADLLVFWEELLEEHGFESDRQWEARQNQYRATVQEGHPPEYGPHLKAPNGKDSWRGIPVVKPMDEPEFWEISSPIDIPVAIRTENSRRTYPERFGVIRPANVGASAKTKQPDRPRGAVEIVYDQDA